MPVRCMPMGVESCSNTLPRLPWLRPWHRFRSGNGQLLRLTTQPYPPQAPSPLAPPHQPRAQTGPVVGVGGRRGEGSVPRLSGHLCPRALGQQSCLAPSVGGTAPEWAPASLHAFQPPNRPPLPPFSDRAVSRTRPPPTCTPGSPSAGNALSSTESGVLARCSKSARR